VIGPESSLTVKSGPLVYVGASLTALIVSDAVAVVPLKGLVAPSWMGVRVPAVVEKGPT
jgi:hypothetical protein